MVQFHPFVPECRCKTIKLKSQSELKGVASNPGESLHPKISLKHNKWSLLLYGSQNNPTHRLLNSITSQSLISERFTYNLIKAFFSVSKQNYRWIRETCTPEESSSPDLIYWSQRFIRAASGLVCTACAGMEGVETQRAWHRAQTVLRVHCQRSRFARPSR